MSSKIENFLGKRVDGKKSRLPARLDFFQSATGLILGLFMWGHMLFVSTVLISPEFFDKTARFFEGSAIFDTPKPGIVSFLVFVILVIFFIHAALGMRKLPITYRQYQIAKEHSCLIKHEDTTLWLIQAGTGFVMFFLGSIHLGMMLFFPDSIGAVGSSTRIVYHNMWVFYLVLLFAVELHGGIGLYRLCVKWGWFDGNTLTSSRTVRKKLKTAKWVISIFFIVLGLANLAVFIKYGFDLQNSLNSINIIIK
ncbi:fumarate reductase cytochrome b subunit [Campylobacter canadensis]|uniref:Fumarate reductase cytochrome b subunit n=1 Tax=Campylobacter canadensis TaxID=449520 RepID=A0ABS7WP81_9BACT|nr:fumarate reductase cytochrome b subunit [Campylobacter canadensis]MBZ7986576.1 fumarate reductase cytochrome b subunit [Campylobacter canadensis]MBZ7997612.1 fumarate reductase cytochrome b subunit [Campylobacter canadensis]